VRRHFHPPSKSSAQPPYGHQRAIRCHWRAVTRLLSSGKLRATRDLHWGRHRGGSWGDARYGRRRRSCLPGLGRVRLPQARYFGYPAPPRVTLRVRHCSETVAPHQYFTPQYQGPMPGGTVSPGTFVRCPNTQQSNPSACSATQRRSRVALPPARDALRDVPTDIKARVSNDISNTFSGDLRYS
jgi:hypothetical protein